MRDQVGNYTVHARSDLLRILKSTDALFAKGLDHSDLAGLVLANVLLRVAQPFQLPKGGLLFEDRRIEQYVPSKFRLPYPVITLEFLNNPDEDGGPDPEIFYPSKYLALCFELDYLQTITEVQIDDHDNELKTCFGLNGIVIWPIVYLPSGDWLPMHGAAAFPPRTNFGKPMPVTVYGETNKKNALDSATPWRPFAPIRGLTRKLTDKQVSEMAVKDSQHEARAMFQMLCALECRNVRIEDRPPSKALQAARARAGKLPLLTYKTLTVDTESTQRTAAVSSGSHASPRTHLRRGHIRRLESGPIWVNATIVNGQTKGFVAKQYSVH